MSASIQTSRETLLVFRGNKMTQELNKLHNKVPYDIKAWDNLLIEWDKIVKELKDCFAWTDADIMKYLEICEM